MKRLLIAFVATILILSVSGIAAENTDSLKVRIDAKHIGFNKSSGNQVVRINISTSGDSLGHIIYGEEYYLINSSGNPKIDKKMILYDANVTSNTLSLIVTRPKAKSGEAFYATIKGIVKLDDKTYYKWLNLSVKKVKKPGTANNTNKPNVTQNTPSGDTGSDANKSPGFEVIGLIMTISMIYFLKKRR